MDQESLSRVPFYYEFRADFVVLDAQNEIKFIKPPVEQFVNEQPIVARENALTRYQSYIDVILQSIGKSYVSDRQARKDLFEYYDAVYERSMSIGGNVISLNKSLSCSIGVYLVDNTKGYGDENDFRKKCEIEYDQLPESEKPLYETFDAYFGSRKFFLDFNRSYLIHGVEYFNGKDELNPLVHGGRLDTEFELYEESGCDYGDYKTEIEVYSNFIDDIEDYCILQTPFDWDGYDKPHSDFGKTDPQDIVTNLPPSTLQELINRGESRTMEFKPFIFYDKTKKRRGSGLPCARAISAFLNSDGGILCVGVKNNKTIQGIDNDLGLCATENPEDSLILMFDEMVYSFFDPFVHNYLDTKFATLDGKRLFFVIVKPSSKPVFIKIITDGVVDRKFFIRRQASNEPLDKLEEFYDYVKVRWSS